MEAAIESSQAALTEFRSFPDLEIEVLALALEVAGGVLCPGIAILVEVPGKVATVVERVSNI